ncbi:hypothetical protein BaRGS_00031540 [Batillaria attramentaria]|uniref:Uncharacterized protein n=1 Tax=Batillaria attramentaria TaxID=370345 RepID=A0ABD0JQH5_9CAEN
MFLVCGLFAVDKGENNNLLKVPPTAVEPAKRYLFLDIHVCVKAVSALDRDVFQFYSCAVFADPISIGLTGCGSAVNVFFPSDPNTQEHSFTDECTPIGVLTGV